MTTFGLVFLALGGFLLIAVAIRLLVEEVDPPLLPERPTITIVEACPLCNPTALGFVASTCDDCRASRQNGWRPVPHPAE